MDDPSSLSRAFMQWGHVFQCFMPNSNAENRAWLIVAVKDGRELHRELLPMRRCPDPAPDAADVAARDARMEEIVAELGLDQDAAT